MSYYDIDSILTDAEKVPCKFELDLPDLGYLDNNPSHALKAGTQLALPLWLAEMLALANTGTSEDSRAPVTLNLPEALSERVIGALKADPRSVPLRDRSAHFYGLGTHMLDLFEERELSAILRRTFVTRAADIALHARKAGDDGVGGSSEDFLRGLDEWERSLFRKAHEGTKSTKEWMDKVKKR
ncbi:GINS complex, Psf3 component [Sodiomyces alkalinus F11]|uniref:DNA replication complex GINS protein PSF3 n=1 Tax=Sodiomyces alkalinus (strain CBS 110278 / VKM F-3762 / F11) TaxID=1314773 RepID=A0A3N2PUX9_SODAK|nr:GINS complex, Psf3 component [Sodiomyces alkalinus F11]ROT38312.1 GINS complex, Psf3 component [Sodiomyces alkalinus F11]